VIIGLPSLDLSRAWRSGLSDSAEGDFRVLAVAGCPAVASAGEGSTGPGCCPSCRSGCSGWSAGRDGLQPGNRGGDPRGPGPVLRETQAQAAAPADDPARDGEQAQPEPFRLPAAGVPGQGEHLGPGQDLAGQGHDLAPQLVLGEALQRQVPQPGVLGAADPVLAPGPLAVPQLQVSELAAFRAGGEAGEPVAVDVGKPQLRPRVGALLTDDDARPGRPAGQVQQAGDVRDPRPPRGPGRCRHRPASTRLRGPCRSRRRCSR